MIDTNALRKKVLDLAIRGKLVPQNPNDEPASVLLERIREEKQRLIREGKIKKDKVDSIIFRGEDNCHYEKVGNAEPVLLEDLPFELPNSWAWVRFSSLIKVISGVSYDKHDVCNKGIRILRGGNINNFNVSLENDDVFLPDGYYDEEKQVHINDILIVASTGSKLSIGKAGYVIKYLENTQIGAFLRIVRPLFEDFAEYIKIIFATNYYKEHILDSIRGSNINNLKNEHISNLLIPVPPIEEQSRIVRYIKEIFTQIDLIEKNQSDYGTLVESLKKAILQSAIQGKLVEQISSDEPASELLARIRAEKKAQLGKKYVESYIYKGDDNRYYEKNGSETQEITEEIPFDIPHSWRWIKVGSLFRHNTGKALNASDTKGILKQYITTSNLYWGKFELEELKEMPFTAEQYEKCSVKKGDLLVCEGGDIGRAAIWNYDFPMCIQNHIHRLRPYSDISIKFYFYIFMLYKQLGLIGGKGIGIQGLSTNALAKIIFPLPPLNEQHRIVKKIDFLFNMLKDED